MGYYGITPRGGGKWNENFKRKGYNPDGTMKEAFRRLLMCWGIAAVGIILSLLEMNWGLTITCGFIFLSTLLYYAVDGNSVYNIDDYFKIPKELNNDTEFNSVYCLKNGVSSSKSEYKDGGYYLDLKNRYNLVKLHDLKFDSPLFYRRLIGFAPQFLLMVIALFDKGFVNKLGGTATTSGILVMCIPSILILLLSFCRIIQLMKIRNKIGDFAKEIIRPGTSD